MISYTYDASVDAIYFTVKKGKVFQTEAIDDGTMVDLSKEGDILGVEVIGLSTPWNLKAVLSAGAISPSATT